MYLLIATLPLCAVDAYVNQEPEVRTRSEPNLDFSPTDEFPPDLLKSGMEKEMKSMGAFDVYEEVPVESLSPEEVKNAMTLRRVYVWKALLVRARLVARGFTQMVEDKDDIYAATPVCTIFTLLTVLGLSLGWSFQFGDVGTAFLRAAIVGDVCV